MSEYGAGQFEVNLHHVTDALVACDHAVLLRRLVRGVAARHGLAATFMAKPFADLDGSGMHVHVSLLDRSGRNVFAPAPPAATPDAYAALLRHAIGGMLAAMPESLAIFCPNANSYRRIRPGCFAPIAPNWGPNHRSVAIRIPVSDDANVRLEHRRGRRGLQSLPRDGRDPGRRPRRHHPPDRAAAHGAGGRDRSARAGDLSHRWETGARRLRRGARCCPDYLGEEFCRVFSAARRFEAEQFHAEVPNLDYDWYLPSI